MPEARRAEFCGRAAHHCASENHTLIFRLLYFLMSINLLACSQPEKNGDLMFAAFRRFCCSTSDSIRSRLRLSLSTWTRFNG